MLFISYAHADFEHVQQLVEILEAGGQSVWFDHKLLPGQNWKAALYEAIRDSHAFIYTLSAASLASEWCQWEFATAVQLKKPVIPVLLQDGTPIPEAIAQLQYADFSQGPTPVAVAKLLSGLQNAQHVSRANIPDIPENPSGVPSRAWDEAANHWTDKVVPSQHTPQNEDEQIIQKFAANLWRGIEAVGGRIVVTNQRLLFEAHGLNIARDPLSIPYAQIADVSKTRTLGLVPNGLLVRTKDGSDYRFVVSDRDEIISLLQSYLR